MHVKKIIFILFLIISNVAIGQINYSYIDPCTGIKKTIQVPSNGVTVTYYGQIHTFQPTDFYSGVFENWANGVYASFGSNNPCASIVGMPTGLTVAQSSALNFLGIINSLDAVKDLAGGGTNFLSGTIESTKKSEKKEKKDDNTNSTSVNAGAASGQTGNSATSPQSGNKGEAQSAGGSQGQSGGEAQSSGGSQPASQKPDQTGGSGSGQAGGGSGSNGSGSPQNPGSETSGGSAQGSTTGSGGQTTGSSSNNSSTSQNGSSSGGGSQGGGQNDATKKVTTTPAGESKTDQPSGSGKTDLVGSSVNNVQRVDAKNGNRPNIIASSDFVGFNFKNSDVSYGGKFTGGYTSARWDGARAHGLLIDYTTALKGPNISGFYAFIKPKRIDLISTTLTLGLDIKKSIYGTIALGQMWDINKKKNVKAVYLLTGSYGSVYDQAFIGTAAIAGGMWDLKLGKRIDAKIMGLYVYAPYVSYYNDILLKSPHVVLPILGCNIKITNKFKININGGGAWALKENTLNYTVMMGTRLLL
jgi:hypothetical protein